MVEIVKRNKALSVSPLKASSTMGAALAFQGVENAIAMLHGAQGCTAYGKIFLIGHFREPVAMQTTAMDQVSTVMGADDNVVEGLKAICDKSAPSLIGIPTTGLAETQGSDTFGAVNVFRDKHPEHAETMVVAVETPDYAGSLETGFAKAVYNMIDVLTPALADGDKGGNPDSPQLNILVNGSLTPGDLEELKEIVELFGLEALILPDLSGSLDGHLTERDFNPLTTGGFKVEDFATLQDACATLVIGDSMEPAADLLAERIGVPDIRLPHLMGLEATDALISALHDLTGQPVPKKLERQRAQLQDTMLDAHFHLGFAKVAVAADPDHIRALGDLVTSMGADLTVAIAPSNTRSLKDVPAGVVKIGDLEELEKYAEERGADIIIGNAHCVATAERLGVPLLRAGFPLFDRMGGPNKVWIGYRGTRQTLFDLANLLIEAEPGAVKPYRSIYAQKQDEERIDGSGFADRAPARAH